MSNEYGIFQTIVEGEQADAYKRNKDRAAKADERKMNNRIFHRGSSIVADKGEEGAEKHMDKATSEMRSKSKSFSKLTDDMNSGKGSKSDLYKAHYAMDAYDRHQRRHGNNESTINFI